MKRFFFVFLPFFVLFVALVVGIFFLNDKAHFFGKSSQQQEDDHILEVSYRGTVKSLGTFAVVNAGTHFLEQDNGQTLLLVGLGVNLDNYLGKKTEVHGRIGSTPSGKELLQVLSAEEISVSDIQNSSDTTTVSMDDTSWSAFSNSGFGVSFQKRNHWIFDINEGKIAFTLPALSVQPCTVEPCPVSKDDYISISRSKNESRVSLETFLKDKKNRIKNKVGADSMNAYKIDSPDGRVEIYVARDNLVYVLAYQPSEKRFGDPHQNDFFELLRTFRFVPFG